MKLFLSISLGLSLSFSVLAQKESVIMPGLSHGLLQSPINVTTSRCHEGRHEIKLHYETSHEHIVHDRHTVEVDYDPGSYVLFDGRAYDFKQFHFHTPSEHLLDGVHYPLEMHMVHVDHHDTEPHYLVIAILFKEGETDPFIDCFLDEVPDEITEVDYANKFIDIREELYPGELNDYYFYKGSLTTPPYTETVSWAIVHRIHEASPEQILRIKELEGDNHRTVQELNNRNVEVVHSEHPQ
jgi:carbonic anhydrase